MRQRSATQRPVGGDHAPTVRRSDARRRRSVALLQSVARAVARDAVRDAFALHGGRLRGAPLPALEIRLDVEVCEEDEHEDHVSREEVLTPVGEITRREQ